MFLIIINLQSIVCLAVIGIASAGLLPAAYVADNHGDYYVSKKFFVVFSTSIQKYLVGGIRIICSFHDSLS